MTKCYSEPILGFRGEELLQGRPGAVVGRAVKKLGVPLLLVKRARSQILPSPPPERILLRWLAPERGSIPHTPKLWTVRSRLYRNRFLHPNTFYMFRNLQDLTPPHLSNQAAPNSKFQQNLSQFACNCSDSFKYFSSLSKILSFQSTLTC